MKNTLLVILLATSTLYAMDNQEPKYGKAHKPTYTVEEPDDEISTGPTVEELSDQELPNNAQRALVTKSSSVGTHLLNAADSAGQKVVTLMSTGAVAVVGAKTGIVLGYIVAPTVAEWVFVPAIAGVASTLVAGPIAAVVGFGLMYQGGKLAYKHSDTTYDYLKGAASGFGKAVVKMGSAASGLFAKETSSSGQIVEEVIQEQAFDLVPVDEGNQGLLQILYHQAEEGVVEGTADVPQPSRPYKEGDPLTVVIYQPSEDASTSDGLDLKDWVIVDEKLGHPLETVAEIPQYHWLDPRGWFGKGTSVIPSSQPVVEEAVEEIDNSVEEKTDQQVGPVIEDGFK